jgi:uncharacterized protein YdhG (YjbR/CyaY superfamily)
MPTRSPRTIDEYLERVAEDKRAALEKLRKAIRAAAPAAEECISYGLPTFRLDGRYLVAFGAATRHGAFYPGSVVQDHVDELGGYDVGKGAIRFPADRPLPATLVRKLVKARIARGKAAASGCRHGTAEARSQRSRHSRTSP